MTEDLALAAARLGSALRAAGVPADPGRCERFARAVVIARPATPRALYLCALATLVSGKDQIPALERVFAAAFAGQVEPPEPAGGHVPPERADRPPGLPAPGGLLGAAGLGAPAPAGQQAGAGEQARAAQAVLASPVERLASRDFAELTPRELALLAAVMRKLTLAVPARRSRRPRSTSRGGQADLRATLRQARRTGGQPLLLARRAPLLRPRRLVVLCDISGSMEPYARAMLQLLYCAAGGARAEVFTFATRLTRLTGALAHARPELALRQAGRSAPDWMGGTRIGDSVKEFNDRHGRRGMARGAVVVVISDGWDTGDPAVLRREMARLSRVAHRIVWVNPRTQHPEYQPLAGGMAAAWPYCDAVVSAHSVDALAELTSALSAPGRRRPATRDGIRSPAWPGLAPRARENRLRGARGPALPSPLHQTT